MERQQGNDTQGGQWAQISACGCFFVGLFFVFLFFFYIKHFFPKCTYNILTGYKAGVLEHMKRSLIGTTIT